MFVPQMANMELIGAVNFKKAAIGSGKSSPARGTWAGQRRMFRVRIADPAAGPGAELFSPASGERVIGNLECRASGWRRGALAVFSAAGAGSGASGSLSGPRLEC